MEKISKPSRLPTRSRSKNHKSFRIIKTIIPIAISISLSACTLMSRMPLDVTQRETIHESRTLLSAQKEIKVAPMPENTYYPAAGGVAGIIAGGLINAAITADAEKQANAAIKPLIRDLRDYNFNDQFQKSLIKELTKIKWLHFNQQQILKKADQKQKDNLINSMKKIGDTSVYIDLTYELSPSMNSLSINARVEMYKKELKKPVLVYENRFSYIDELPVQNSSIKLIDIWSANHSERVRNSMDKAIKLLSSAITRDISDPSVKPDNNKPTNVWYNTSFHNGAAYLEEKVGKKSIIRTSSGEIIIVNDASVTPKHNWRE